MAPKWLTELHPVMEKWYFVADTPEGKNPGFKWLVYKLIDSKNECTLVHYIGDGYIGSQHPRGNCKAAIKNHT